MSMHLMFRWILPIALVGIGIAVFFGLLLREMPAGTGLRFMLGLICVLLGVYRFAAARTERPASRRRYGGSFHRPWENDKHE
jgi:hypothetical protein